MENRTVLGIACASVIGTAGGAFLGYRKGRKKSQKDVNDATTVLMLAADFVLELEKGINGEVEDERAWVTTCEEKADFFHLALRAMED